MHREDFFHSQDETFHEDDDDEFPVGMTGLTLAGAGVGVLLLLLLLFCCCRRNRGRVLSRPAVAPPPPPGHVPYPQQQYIVEIPTAYSVVPAQNAAYQQAAPYPPQVAPYPTHGASYPTQGAPYPAQGPPYPAQVPPYPTQGPPYPTEGAPYLTQGAPYPTVPSAPDASALPPTYDQAVCAADKSSPYNPQVPR